VVAGVYGDQQLIAPNRSQKAGEKQPPAAAAANAYRRQQPVY